MSPYGGIYAAARAGVPHAYVGQTIALSKRWQKHCSDAKNGKPTAFAAALRKHGVEAFTIEVVAECADKEALDAAEEFYVRTLQPRYNMISGGGSVGIPNDEVRKKISAATRGRPKSPEQKAAQAQRQRGRKLAEETKERIRLALAGKSVRKTPLRDEEVEALIQRNKARRVRPERHDLRAAYAQAGALTKEAKQSVARQLWHAANKAVWQNPMVGKQHTAAAKARIREAATGTNNPFYGKRHSEETRAKMRAAHAARPAVECPHCGKSGVMHAMKRWHFSNCRSKA